VKDKELKFEEVEDSTPLIRGAGEGVVEGLIFRNNLMICCLLYSGGIHDSVVRLFMDTQKIC
jgi:hypothetical protein